MLRYVFTYSLIQLPTYSHTHSHTHSLTHSLTHSHTHAFTPLLPYSFTHFPHAQAYCSQKSYLTRDFTGPTDGFVATYAINSDKTSGDVTGYIGYLPSTESIYVVYRGSSSISNWIADLDAFKVTYTSWPECNCEVHKGFYLSEQGVIDDVKAEVFSLLNQFPNYDVKLTGHSLGAAMAQLTSMDLIKAGIPVTSVYNFGQPRVGDYNYADFASGKVNTFRVTHYQDIVPHVPITTAMEFYHACTEEYEDKNGSLKTCTDTCEDPSCADQWKAYQWSVEDHMTYLGLYMDCSSV